MTGCNIHVIQNSKLKFSILISDVVGLALGEEHSMISKRDGSVWSTAVTVHGGVPLFMRVIPSGAIAMSAGNSYSIVIKQGGDIWAAGKNSVGQHGDGVLGGLHAIVPVGGNGGRFKKNEQRCSRTAQEVGGQRRAEVLTCVPGQQSHGPALPSSSP